MAYEIKFICHKRDDTGSYNTDEKEEFVKFLGKRTEDVPLEKLALLVMNQMSRRDIWVTDVQIFEFVKREIKFREVNGGKGIVIDGKKFNLEQQFTSLLESEEDEVPAPPPVQAMTQEQMMRQMQQTLVDLQRQVAQQPQQQQYYPQPQPQMHMQQPAPVQRAPQGPSQPLRYEYFKPDPDLLKLARERKLKYTFDKAYPIYRETTANNGVIYQTQDDTGKMMVIHSAYFVPRIIDSTGNNSLDALTSKIRNGEEPILTFDGEEDSEPIVLRRM